MQFFVSSFDLSGEDLEISRNEYDSLIASRKVVKSAIKLDDLFSVFAESFIEFEKFLVTNLIERHYRREFFSGRQDRLDLVGLNLRLMSVLSSARLYHDQRSSLALQVTDNSHSVSSMNALFSERYDRSFSYRIVEALRNHAQHADLPIGNTKKSLWNQWEDEDDKENSPMRTLLSFSPLIIREALQKNKRLSKRIRLELGSIPEKDIDLKSLIRGYVALMSEAHILCEEKMDPYLEKALVEIRGIQTRYCDLVSRDVGEVRNTLFLRAGSEDWNEAEFIGSRLTEAVSNSRGRWVCLRRCETDFFSTELRSSSGVTVLRDENTWVA